MHFLQNLQPGVEFQEASTYIEKDNVSLETQKSHHARCSVVIGELQKPSDDFKPTERTGETEFGALQLLEKLSTLFKSRFSSQIHHFVNRF